MLAKSGNHCAVGISVNYRFVLDIARSRRVLEGVQRLLEVAFSRRYACDHSRARVPAERVLQDARQFRVAIGDVEDLLGLISERRDHVS